MASPYVVGEADLNDGRDEVKTLWARNLRGLTSSVADAKLQSGYLANPAGRGVILALRLRDEGTVVGVQGVHPRTMHYGASVIRGANLADFAVAPEHRTLGPALTLLKHATALAAARFDLLYGMPNPKSAAVCERAGLRRVGSIQRHAKALRSRTLLTRYLPPVLAGALAPCVDLGLRLADVWRAERGRQRLTCRAASFDEPAIDAIWSRRPADLLLSERTAAMLRWRYAAAESGAWQVSIASAADGVPVGYVVWALKSGVAIVGDFFSTEPRRQSADLMLAFSAHARAQGAEVASLLFFGVAEVAAGLRGAGFGIRSTNALVYAGHLGPATAQIDPQAHWYGTSFDDDAD